jgi:hypothetical protein
MGIDTKPAKKYFKGERVKVCGWGSEDTGVIEAIDWIHHYRADAWCWGYKIVFENGGPGLAFTYIPEGYLRKLHDTDGKIKLAFCDSKKCDIVDRLAAENKRLLKDMLKIDRACETQCESTVRHVKRIALEALRDTQAIDTQEGD